jgi:hypothetical protein
VIDENHLTDAVQALHDAFELETAPNGEETL